MKNEMEGNHLEHKLPVQEDVLSEKFFACLGIVQEELGVANVYQAGKYFYHSLFYPKELKALANFAENPKFPRRTNFLEEQTTGLTENPPSEEEFIRKFCHAVTQEAYFEKALFPEAKEFVSKLMDMGPTAVWTMGDTVGFAEKKLPGSLQQVKNIASVGFGKLRREKADEKNLDPKKLLKIISSEDKFNSEFIEQLLDYLSKNEIENLFVIEDRPKNLEKIKRTLENQSGNFRVIPILINHKKSGNGASEGEKNYVAGDFEEILMIINSEIRESATKKSGFLVDFDGVLMDDNVRRRLLAGAVKKMLEEKGWLKQE